MNRWINPSHPQTLFAAVILGYLSAVFGLFEGLLALLPVLIGVGVGAFGSANNKRWGYYLLAGCAFFVALFWVYQFAISLGGELIITLFRLNRLVFPIALAVAALHPHSREYQRVWFE